MRLTLLVALVLIPFASIAAMAAEVAPVAPAGTDAAAPAASLDTQFKSNPVVSPDMKIVSHDQGVGIKYPSRPQGVSDVPPGAVVYAAPFGNRSFIFAVAGNNLYVDSDFNRSFKGEEAYAGAPAKGASQSTAFGPVAITAPGAKSSGRMFVTVSRGGLVFCPAEFLTGKVQAGADTYDAVLVDGNYDGLYDGRFDARGASDTLAIDLNKNGKLDVTTRPGSELVPMPRFLKIKNAWYGVTPAADGSTVALAPAEPKMGTLSAASSEASLELVSDSGYYALSGKGPWELPEGSYSARSVAVTGKGKDGYTWKLASQGTTGKLASFDVKGGEATAFEAGAPVTLKAVPTRYAGSVTVDFSMVGGAGEVYQSASLNNARKVVMPSVKIVDRSGKVLSSGKFEAG